MHNPAVSTLEAVEKIGFSVCVYADGPNRIQFSLCVSHALFLVASFTGENHSVFKTLV